jgi:hypothetical protein
MLSNGLLTNEESESEPQSRRARFFGKLKHRLNGMERKPIALRRESEPAIATGTTLDLSLGQERAGGGFAGKQAKMGKLIIHQDGLVMLDLLVAANMSLWWRAYEKENSTTQG